jgi:hypothetical protein
LIQSNWSTIQNIRANAPNRPVKPVDPEARATNAWVLGLTAYVRLARGVGDSTTESAALADLANALGVRSGQGVGGAKGNGFGYTSAHGLYWIEGWDEWTPDFGRWLRDEFGAGQISDQIDVLVTDNRIYLWYESDLSHAHNGESQQQASWISFPIYQAYTAALANVGTAGTWTYDEAARAFLRDRLPQAVVSRVTPYHRDAYYLQNLVALIRAHGTTTWVAAPSGATATADRTPSSDFKQSPAGQASNESLRAVHEPGCCGEGQATVTDLFSNADVNPAVSAQRVDDWPQFMHDPQNTGFSRDGFTEGPVSDYQGWPVENLQLLWRKNVGVGTHGRAQPVVADNIVYQGFLDGQFLAMSGDDGETVWSYQAGGPITGAGAVSQGSVFFGSWDGRIYCRDAATGAEIWTYDTRDLTSTPPVMRGRVKAPLLVVGDTLFVGAGNRYFYALDAATGNLKWRYAANANIESSAAYANNKVIFMTEVGYDADLPAGRQVAITGIALNANDGSIAWKVPVPGERAGTSYPVIAGDYVLFIGEPADQTPYGIWITSDWEYFGSSSYVTSYGGADNVLRLAAEMINNYPHHQASLVVNVDTGQERLFDIPGMAQRQPIPLGSVYNNWIIPVVYEDKFLFSQFHGLWIADPLARSITHRFDRNIWMDGIRQEEYHQFVGALDYLIFSGTGGEVYWLDLTAPNGNATTLLDPEWGHFPDKWADTATAPINYLPGQGNGYVEASGYAIPSGGRLYVAAVPGWFYAFEGNRVAGSPDLVESEKTASSTSALVNETITFTISFAGTGEPTTVTDMLPIPLTHVSSRATCAGAVTYSGTNRQVVYSGTPSADSVCAVEISTQVNTDQRMVVTNTATVDNGLEPLHSVSERVILNGSALYLPLILR